MNLSALFGMILAVGVVAGSVAMATDDWKVFLDIHAAVIVIGGTIAAGLLSFSGKKMITLLQIIWRNVIMKNHDWALAIKEIVEISKGYRENEKFLKEYAPKIKTHFLKEAIQLMVDGGIDPDELDMILRKRATTMQHRLDEDAEIFKSLSRLAPAFGLLGAVIGMIAMMQSLGGADSFTKVGPALAVALVATLYGIAAANFIFLPLGENLAKLNRHDAITRQMVLDGVRLIRAKKHPLVVEETLRSLLLPSERVTIKKAV